MLASLSDVAARIDDPDVVVDEDYAVGLLEEASALVEGYLGRTFPDGGVPSAVRLVVSRMAARVIQSPKDAGFNQESASYTAGPYSQQVTYTAGASGGSPWLTASDKTALSQFRKRHGGGVFSMTMM